MRVSVVVATVLILVICGLGVHLAVKVSENEARTDVQRVEFREFTARVKKLTYRTVEDVRQAAGAPTGARSSSSSSRVEDGVLKFHSKQTMRDSTGGMVVDVELEGTYPTGPRSNPTMKVRIGDSVLGDELARVLAQKYHGEAFPIEIVRGKTMDP